MKAVVLVSGGLDSCVCLATALDECEEVYALSIAYGQRHLKELECAEAILDTYDIPAARRKVIRLPIDEVATRSALVNRGIGVNERSESDAALPATFVPARNIIFLAYAASWAETVGADAIYIGVNALDYSGYPDCRPEFIAAMEKALTRGLNRKLRIMAPLQHMSKADIIREGLRFNAPLWLTWSCYAGRERPCGECESCALRARGFAQVGIPDDAALRWS